MTKNRLNTIKNEPIRVKPYSIGDLAALYGICYKTLHLWMEPFKEELGPRRGRFYNIKQVKLIFDKLSVPTTIDPDADFKENSK